MRNYLFIVSLLIILGCEKNGYKDTVVFIQGCNDDQYQLMVNTIQFDSVRFAHNLYLYNLSFTLQKGKKDIECNFIFKESLSYSGEKTALQFKHSIYGLRDKFKWNLNRVEDKISLEGLSEKQRLYLAFSKNRTH